MKQVNKQGHYLMVNVRMTPDEKKTIKRGAELRYLSGISTFMRQLAVDESNRLIKQAKESGGN